MRNLEVLKGVDDVLKGDVEVLNCKDEVLKSDADA